MNLIEKYGYCRIPKGSILFHSGYIHKDADSIFFGFVPLTAKASPNSNNRIEIWKLKTDIKLLFMVLEVAHFSWTKSAITEIYRYFFPFDDLCNDIEIKYSDRSKRRKFINKLKQQEIIGWFSSFEDKSELEVCLFKNENLVNLIEFIKVVEMEELYAEGFDNSLKKADLHLNNNFYESSNSKLLNFPFNSYKKHVASCIREEKTLVHQKSIVKIQILL
jgi:hypothetical protein